MVTVSVVVRSGRGFGIGLVLCCINTMRPVARTVVHRLYRVNWVLGLVRSACPYRCTSTGIAYGYSMIAPQPGWTCAGARTVYIAFLRRRWLVLYSSIADYHHGVGLYSVSSINSVCRMQEFISGLAARAPFSDCISH